MQSVILWNVDSVHNSVFIHCAVSGTKYHQIATPKLENHTCLVKNWSFSQNKPRLFSVLNYLEIKICPKNIQITFSGTSINSIETFPGQKVTFTKQPKIFRYKPSQHKYTLCAIDIFYRDDIALSTTISQSIFWDWNSTFPSGRVAFYSICTDLQKIQPGWNVLKSFHISTCPSNQIH